MKNLFILIFLVAGVTTLQAQIKIGKMKIDTKKAIQAGKDAAGAITLSDEDIASMSKEYMQWMDTHNKLAAPDSELGKRLAKITANFPEIEGLKLNFGVYEVVDVNAFACGDGSIRVCAGLMELMTDDEVLAVIGHEIGHVVHHDSKNAMKNAYLRSAAKNAAGALNENVSKLTDSQLGDLAEAFKGAQFSLKPENAAEDYAFDFCIRQNVDAYAMSKALNKLVELSAAGGEKANLIQKMFSSHPGSAERAARLKEKADNLQKK